MSSRIRLSDLPTELLLHVAGELSRPDLSSLSLSNRQLHQRLLSLLFDPTRVQRCDITRPLEQSLVNLFLHAVKHDSTNITQHLICSTSRIKVTGPIQSNEQRNAARQSTNIRWFLISHLPPNFTFLHFALVADAPNVAATLIKNGAEIIQGAQNYPYLISLALALPRSFASSASNLDSALRVACSYALPRTTHFLLARGANANTYNEHGIAAIHTAVFRRHPWHEFPIVGFIMSLQQTVIYSHWELMLLQTLSAMLDFGINIDIRTQSLRPHECSPLCWRSTDCDHRGQTALHIASASGMLAIVSRLIVAGANPNLPDGQGYTPLYVALVQGHENIACHILQVCNGPLNPVVYIPDRSTALHIACRFSFAPMVEKLLSRRAYANVIDSHGRTPLHDVLVWANLNREDEVILTLEHLIRFGADPDTTTSWQTPRHLGETHPSMRVRNLFLAIPRRNQIQHTRHFGALCNSAEGLDLRSSDSLDTRKPKRKAGGSKVSQNTLPPLSEQPWYKNAGR